jgi:hypothetical protein
MAWYVSSVLFAQSPTDLASVETMIGYYCRPSPPRLPTGLAPVEG